MLYRSRDLIRWEYLRPILVGDGGETEPVWTGTMWECPGLLPLGDGHVLIVSVFDGDNLHYPVYFLGDYENGEFIPKLLRKVDHGGYFYAPQTMIDEGGRAIMWGWLQEGRDEEVQLEAGWSGVMSLPRVLSMRPDGLLGVEPAPELRTLRGEHYRFEDLDIGSDSSRILEGVRDNCLEIVAQFEPGDAAELGLKVCRSPEGEEETLVVYDSENGRLAVDPRRSSLHPATHRDIRWGPLEPAGSRTLKLHVFLDRSVIEVFAEGVTCVTGRIYPTRADSRAVELFARGGGARVKTLDVWEMRPIWASRG